MPQSGLPSPDGRVCFRRVFSRTQCWAPASSIPPHACAHQPVEFILSTARAGPCCRGWMWGSPPSLSAMLRRGCDGAGCRRPSLDTPALLSNFPLYWSLDLCPVACRGSWTHGKARWPGPCASRIAARRCQTALLGPALNLSWPASAPVTPDQTRNPGVTLSPWGTCGENGSAQL